MGSRELLRINKIHKITRDEETSTKTNYMERGPIYFIIPASSSRFH